MPDTPSSSSHAGDPERQRSRLAGLRKRAFSRESFMRDVGKLVAGSGGAQIVNLLGSLVLARLFLPAEFIGITLLVPTAMILSRISQLKYETAIATARNKAEMGALAAIANVCLWSVAALSVIVSLVMLPTLIDKLGVAGAIVFIVCLPVTVLFNGWLNVANIWAVRWRRFNVVAANEFIRVTGTMAVQIVAGLAKAGSAGLMAGQACGTAMAYFAMTWRGSLVELKARAKRTSWKRMRLVAWAYRDFALFQTPKAAINVSSRNLPPILLGALYDPTITGLFYFAFRLTLLPANLLGVSVGRVLMQRFANMRQQKRRASPMLVRSTFLILVPSLLLVGVLWIFGPPLFALVLGEEWRAAGELASWTALWSASIIVANPGEQYLIVHRRNGLLFTLELLFLIPRFAPFVYFAAQQNGTAAIIWCCAASSAYSLVTAAAAMLISRREERPGSRAIA